jgi:hypothetical protein
MSEVLDQGEADEASGGRRGGPWRLYGDGPRHLLALLGCFLLAGYAALRLLAEDVPVPGLVRIVVWFVGAAVVWDLVLGPLLALVDRGLRGALRRVRPGGVSPLNYVRAPALVSALLLLMWLPLILERSQGVYGAKAGLDSSVYLGRWLAVAAVLFAVSAVLFVVALLRARRR